MIIKKETDKGKVAELLQYFFDTFYKKNEVSMAHVRNSEEYIQKIAENATTLFAYIQNKVVGFCSLYINFPPYAYITFYGVDPLFRGQGIAHKIISSAVEMAVDVGCISISARVDKRNIKSLKTLKDCGFVMKEEEENVFLLEWLQEKKS